MQLGCGGRRDCAEAVVVVKIGVNDMVERNSDATLVCPPGQERAWRGPKWVRASPHRWRARWVIYA